MKRRVKNSKVFLQILQIFAKISEIRKNLAIFCKNNRFSRKMVRKFSENFRKIWQYKFSETAFLAETAGNGVWDLVGDANSDPMVYKSSKSAFWRRKIQFSVKIRKIRKFGTISCESPLIFDFNTCDGK